MAKRDKIISVKDEAGQYWYINQTNGDLIYTDTRSKATPMTESAADTYKFLIESENDDTITVNILEA